MLLVLVGSDGHCKLSSFGLSKIGVFHHDRASSNCGTPLYMAPDVITILILYHSKFVQPFQFWVKIVVRMLS
jgi:serine/threonine protein kinase